MVKQLKQLKQFCYHYIKLEENNLDNLPQLCSNSPFIAWLGPKTIGKRTVLSVGCSR